MDGQPYYTTYEHRYRTVYGAGGRRWGTPPEDSDLVGVLLPWIEENRLAGKSVVEFACGEGGPGVLFARAGCRYHGVDIAPAALEVARATLAAFPSATVERLDLTRERPAGTYDAGFDSMGFHMLVLDADRAAYLANAFACLAPGAPMLFHHECHDPNADETPVATFADWLARTGHDYHTPEPRALEDDRAVEILLPRVPARARSDDGYRREFAAAGFAVERIRPIKPGWASIFVRKPS